MKRLRSYSPYTVQATRLLGAQIAQARRERRWSARELAERAGITRATLHSIERGEPSVGIGIAFETAALLGVPLFREEPAQLTLETERASQRLALLPQRIRRTRQRVKDDF